MEFFWSTPFALVLSGLLLIPILAHLIQRNPRKKKHFGAMMLLQRLQRVKRRRRRLADFLLLLLRLLALAAIVLVATSPELRWFAISKDSSGPQKIVLIIDNSLSMNHKMQDLLHPNLNTAFAHARQKAITQIQNTPEGSRFLIVEAGGEANMHGSWISDATTAMASLKDIQKGYGKTDLLGALRIARRQLEGKGGEVYIYTDDAGDHSSLKEELKLLSEQKGALHPITVRATAPQNIVIQEASYSSGIEGGTVRYRLMNFGAQAREVLCTTRLPDGTEIRNFVQVGAETSAENFITVPRIADGGVGSIHVEDEFLEEDNSFFFHLPRIGASRVLVIDGEPGLSSIGSEVYFLERALAPFGGQNETLPDVINPAGIGQLQADVHRVVFMANVMEPAPLAATLIDFVRDGGGLLISLGGNVSVQRYNSALETMLPATLRSIQNLAQRGEQGKPMALPDVSNELFAPFRRGGLQEFGNVRWKTLFGIDKLRSDAKVLLSMENGAPVLIERDFGKGKVLLLLGSIDHDWGNFPLQSIFMPFIQRSVTHLGGASSLGGKRIEGIIDQKIEVPIREFGGELVLDGPKGSVGMQYEQGKIRFSPNRIGAYKLYTHGAPPLAQIAINVEPQESDIRSKGPLISIAAEVEPERFIQRKPLTPWLLWGALIALLIQALIAFFLYKPKETHVQS